MQEEPRQRCQHQQSALNGTLVRLSQTENSFTEGMSVGIIRHKTRKIGIIDRSVRLTMLIQRKVFYLKTAHADGDRNKGAEAGKSQIQFHF
jgi:hypothetical protein